MPLCAAELAQEVEGLPPALRSAYPDLLADYVASVIKKGDERPVNRQELPPQARRVQTQDLCCVLRISLKSASRMLHQLQPSWSVCASRRLSNGALPAPPQPATWDVLERMLAEQPDSAAAQAGMPHSPTQHLCSVTSIAMSMIARAQTRG